MGLSRYGAYVFALTAALVTSDCASATPIVWNTEIVEHEANWYGSEQARALADNIIQYQSPQGGWPKNTDLAAPLPSSDAVPGAREGRANTFDNDATTLPMEFLAQVIHAGGRRAHRDAFDRGLDYMLAAQYPNGGWPQYYPLREGYYSHITFNDDAMIHVMIVLRDVAAGQAPYDFTSAEQRERAGAAVARGIELILRTQVRQNGVLTAWCAQHDVQTLEPAWARAFEPPSLSGNESVAVVRFLMSVEHPTPEIVAAVQAAVIWLEGAAIPNLDVENFTDEAGQPDRRVRVAASAEPIWARFYELGSNRPIFLGRDSIVRYSFAEIERERRAGYHYYGRWAQSLVRREYPAWRARHGL
jgi:PelA/Pel-15E family pectate lyase